MIECAQFPTLRHGDNTVNDSVFITKYLKNTYPEKLAAIEPATPEACAPVCCLRIWASGNCVYLPVHVLQTPIPLTSLVSDAETALTAGYAYLQLRVAILCRADACESL